MNKCIGPCGQYVYLVLLHDGTEAYVHHRPHVGGKKTRPGTLICRPPKITASKKRKKPRR